MLETITPTPRSKCIIIVILCFVVINKKHKMHQTADAFISLPSRSGRRLGLSASLLDHRGCCANTHLHHYLRLCFQSSGKYPDSQGLIEALFLFKKEENNHTSPTERTVKRLVWIIMHLFDSNDVLNRNAGSKICKTLHACSMNANLFYISKLYS